MPARLGGPNVCSGEVQRVGARPACGYGHGREVTDRIPDLGDQRYVASIQAIGHLEYYLVDAGTASRAALIGHSGALPTDVEFQVDGDVSGLRRIYVRVTVGSQSRAPGNCNLARLRRSGECVDDEVRRRIVILN